MKPIEIAVITDRMLRMNASYIIDDYRKRQQTRFRSVGWIRVLTLIGCGLFCVQWVFVSIFGLFVDRQTDRQTCSWYI